MMINVLDNWRYGDVRGQFLRVDKSTQPFTDFITAVLQKDNQYHLWMQANEHYAGWIIQALEAALIRHRDAIGKFFNTDQLYNDLMIAVDGRLSLHLELTGLAPVLPEGVVGMHYYSPQLKVTLYMADLPRPGNSKFFRATQAYLPPYVEDLELFVRDYLLTTCVRAYVSLGVLPIDAGQGGDSFEVNVIVTTMRTNMIYKLPTVIMGSSTSDTSVPVDGFLLQTQQMVFDRLAGMSDFALYMPVLDAWDEMVSGIPVSKKLTIGKPSLPSKGWKEAQNFAVIYFYRSTYTAQNPEAQERIIRLPGRRTRMLG